MDDEVLPQGAVPQGLVLKLGPHYGNLLERQMGWHQRHGQGDRRSIRVKSGALICRGDERLSKKVGQ